MIETIKNIIREKVKKLKEQSSTGVGGATFSPGAGAQYATPAAFNKNTNAKGTKSIYYYKLGYKPVPKKVKGSGLEVKQLFEDEMLNEYNDFQQDRIKAFELVENELNSLLPLISNAKNETAEFYAENPGSYEVVTGTDLILEYIKDIKTLLIGEQ
jgi:hypothetical protein